MSVPQRVRIATGLTAWQITLHGASYSRIFISSFARSRVNVSLSRARCLCVLVGHLEALASKREGGGPEWRKARGLSGASGDSDSWGHHWRHFVEHVGRMGQRVDAEVLEAE